MKKILRRKTMGAFDDLTGKLDELKDTVADKAKELKEGAEEKASELKDKALGGVDNLINKIK